MRADVYALIKKHKSEITQQEDLFDFDVIEDWFYYDDSFVLNVHDYNEDGVLSIQAYGYDKDGNTDWGWVLFDDKMTLEEFNSL